MCVLYDKDTYFQHPSYLHSYLLPILSQILLRHNELPLMNLVLGLCHNVRRAYVAHVVLCSKKVNLDKSCSWCMYQYLVSICLTLAELLLFSVIKIGPTLSIHTFTGSSTP